MWALSPSNSGHTSRLSSSLACGRSGLTLKCVCSIRFYRSLTCDSPGEDVSNHMRIVFTHGCVCVRVCVCVCCHVSAATFFYFLGRFVILIAFICFLVSSAGSCSSYPWTHTLSLDQSTQSVFLECGGMFQEAWNQTQNLSGPF